MWGSKTVGRERKKDCVVIREGKCLKEKLFIMATAKGKILLRFGALFPPPNT